MVQHNHEIRRLSTIRYHVPITYHAEPKKRYLLLLDLIVFEAASRQHFDGTLPEAIDMDWLMSSIESSLALSCAVGSKKRYACRKTDELSFRLM